MDNMKCKPCQYLIKGKGVIRERHTCLPEEKVIKCTCACHSVEGRKFGMLHIVACCSNGWKRPKSRGFY